MSRLLVVKPGMLTSVQDLGRWGHQGLGVPVAGPMDVYSHRLANWLVGNDADAAALEVTLIGPELEADEPLACAVAGATFALFAGERPVPMHEPFTLPAGARLRFGSRAAGARATLAVRGGLATPPLFGSRSTSLVAAMGGVEGRALKAGDVIDVDYQPPDYRLSSRPPALPLPAGGATLRVIRGPHTQMFTAAAYETLFSARYTITASSNRMGYRLGGPALAHVGSADILSDATPLGSIQVPASGLPIVLMADRQTTGGYPKIATVISADIPIAGQLAPGDWVGFRDCTPAQAVDALRARMSHFT